jgi:hypothetical protein
MDHDVLATQMWRLINNIEGNLDLFFMDHLVFVCYFSSRYYFSHRRAKVAEPHHRKCV